MRSTCYVILPKGISENDIKEFIRNQISKYNINLEVEPYIEFCDLEVTLRTAEIQGFPNDLDGYAEHLKNTVNDAGIENGLLYYIMTYNNLGQWDYYTISDCVDGATIEHPPHSVVTLDGVWHSIGDVEFGYKPNLDWKNNFEIHDENIEPAKKWDEFFSKILEECKEHQFAILSIHS